MVIISILGVPDFWLDRLILRIFIFPTEILKFWSVDGIVVFPMEKYTFWSVDGFVIFESISLLLHVLANIHNFDADLRKS